MTENHWTWTIEQRLPSELGAAEPFIDEVIGRIEHEGWSNHDAFSIRLALEEAVVNATKHGNRHSPEKEIHVRCRLGPERLWAEITDEGAGFDPDSLPDPTAPENIEKPSGRGVMLMRSFMTRVEYHDRGNRVVMEKQRATASPG